MSASLAYAEALAAAIRVEENGALFYRKAAVGALDPAAAQVFSNLAAMEDEHRKYFSALAQRLEQKEGLFGSDPTGSFAAAVRDMADIGMAGLSGTPAAFFEGKRSPKEGVEFALGIEKDSIIFYLTIQEAMADRNEAEKIGVIIREELRHIALLLTMLKKIKKQQ
ncbi:MAG: ferritin family protein [Elusimicrobiota bacterium]